MNDDRFLKDWLQDTTNDTPDPQASADRVLARVPQIRQRSRWWPWLPGRRRRDDGKPSSPQGRTRFMLSPAKAVIAGALALATSAMFLVAQSSDGPAGAPGAELPADPAPPVEVTGRYLSIDCTEGPEDEPVYTITCEVLLDWSDPRLEGTDLATQYATGDDESLEVLHKVHDIVNDDGAWRMRPQIRFEYPGGPDPNDNTTNPEWWVLDGEGAYEGLSVLLSKDGLDLRGFIVSSDVVPPPPLDHRGDVVPGAGQGVAPEAPVEVMAEYRGMGACDDDDPPPELIGSYEIGYYQPCEVLLDWSDPRLDGTDLWAGNSTSYDFEDGSFMTFDHKVHDIVTDDGAWRMRPQLRFDAPGYPDPESAQWWVLEGEGAYEGMVALLILEGEDLHGFIVSAELVPPVPEHSSSE